MEREDSAPCSHERRRHPDVALIAAHGSIQRKIAVRSIKPQPSSPGRARKLHEAAVFALFMSYHIGNIPRDASAILWGQLVRQTVRVYLNRLNSCTEEFTISDPHQHPQLALYSFLSAL